MSPQRGYYKNDEEYLIQQEIHREYLNVVINNIRIAQNTMKGLNIKSR